MQILTFYTTFSTYSEAHTFLSKGISESIFACGNIWTIQSQYIWKAQHENAQEYACLVKSTLASKPDILTFIEANHPYEVPCVLIDVVETTEAYGGWIEAQLDKRE